MRPDRSVATGSRDSKPPVPHLSVDVNVKWDIVLGQKAKQSAAGLRPRSRSDLRKRFHEPTVGVPWTYLSLRMTQTLLSLSSKASEGYSVALSETGEDGFFQASR
jgi:hypothetical protein